MKYYFCLSSPSSVSYIANWSSSWPKKIDGGIYRVRVIYWVKGSVCFGLKFCTPSQFFPSPLCVGSYKTKQALNLWPNKYLDPCTYTFWGLKQGAVVQLLDRENVGTKSTISPHPMNIISTFCQQTSLLESKNIGDSWLHPYHCKARCPWWTMNFRGSYCCSSFVLWLMEVLNLLPLLTTNNCWRFLIFFFVSQRTIVGSS